MDAQTANAIINGVPFNPNQLATYEEARALRDLLNSDHRFENFPILAGDDSVLPQPVANPNFPWLPPVVVMVGIFIPSWVGGPGGFVEPQIGKALFLHYRFKGIRDPHNVGLMIDKFRRYPNSPQYVLSALAQEIGG